MSFQPLIDQNKLVSWSDRKLSEIRQDVDLNEPCKNNFFGHRVKMLKGAGVLTAEFLGNLGALIALPPAALFVRGPTAIFCRDENKCTSYKEKTAIFSKDHLVLLAKRVLAVFAGIFATLFGVIAPSVGFKAQEKLNLITSTPRSLPKKPGESDDEADEDLKNVENKPEKLEPESVTNGNEEDRPVNDNKDNLEAIDS